MAARPEGFTEFVQGRAHLLLRTATLLTQDRHAGEDLLQAALVRAWRSWDRINGEPEHYVRRILVREFLRSRERRWVGERPVRVLPEPGPDDLHAAAGRDPQETVSERLALLRALAALPPRQRAVLVLRYYHDYTHPQVADALGLSVGTVKTHHARALTALRLSDDVVDLMDGRGTR